MVVGLWWLLLLMSYVVYPFWMKRLARRRNMPRYAYYERYDELPEVAIVMSIHNEEKVLGQKLQSVFDGSYEQGNIHLFIGLDDCTDQSLSIVQDYACRYPGQVHFVVSKRLGKPQMLNHIFEEFQPQMPICILTDANVIFTQDTIYELVKYFKSDLIGLVDSKFVLSKDIITHEMENDYLNFEQQLKYHEGKVAGVMQGPFGGCFAIRTSLFRPIPQNFLVDDFFIGMNVMVQGYDAIMHPLALVVEEVHTSWQEEFNRKKRISAGNFQNLRYFSYILLKPFTALSAAWFFHKVLRWVLPIALLPVIVLGYIEFLVFDTGFWLSTITLILILSVVFTLYILQRLNLHSRTIERLSYFIYINLALVQGFIIYIKGIKSNVWKPTQRK